MAFADLPAELVALIFAQDLSLSDLHALSLTNRASSEAATRHLYSSLILCPLRTADPARMDPARKLRRTLLRWPRLASAARELQIGMSSPRPWADHAAEWGSIVEDVLDVTTLRRIAMQGIGQTSASQRVVDVLAGTGSRITHLNIRGAFNGHRFGELFRSLTSLVELSTCEMHLLGSLIDTPRPTFCLRVLSAPRLLTSGMLGWLTSESQESLEILDGVESTDLSAFTNLHHLRLYFPNVIKTPENPDPLPLLPTSPNLTLSLDLSDKYGMVAGTAFEILSSLEQLPLELVRFRGLFTDPNTKKPKFVLAGQQEEIVQRCAAMGARCVWPAGGCEGIWRDVFDMEEWWSSQIVRRSFAEVSPGAEQASE